MNQYCVSFVKPTSLRRYCFYLYFQLKTHNEAMQPEEADAGAALDSETAAEIAEGPALSLLGSISILTVITLLVAAASECARRLPCGRSDAVHCRLVDADVSMLDLMLRGTFELQ